MTKEEKIKEAYGKFYDSYHINEYGWFDNTDYRITGLQLQELESCDYRISGVFRPKSLRGIENNNGWIKIESESDLPTAFKVVLIQFEKETDGLKPIVKTGYWCGNSFTAHGGNPILTNNVTHWRNLPDSPLY